MASIRASSSRIRREDSLGQIYSPAKPWRMDLQMTTTTPKKRAGKTNWKKLMRDQQAYNLAAKQIVLPEVAEDETEHDGDSTSRASSSRASRASRTSRASRNRESRSGSPSVPFDEPKERQEVARDIQEEELIKIRQAVMEELESVLSTLPTHHFPVVTAYGHGRGEVGIKPIRRFTMAKEQQRNIMAPMLRELGQVITNFSVSHHHEYETIKQIQQMEDCKEEEDEDECKDGDDQWDEMTVYSEITDCTFIRNQNHVDVREDDEYTECTVETSAFCSTPPPPPPPHHFQHPKRTPDDDEYTEYTIETSAFAKVQPQQVQQHPAVVQQPVRVPDDDEYTEYTVETSAFVGGAKLQTPVASTPPPTQQRTPEDDEYTEYTVEETTTPPVSNSFPAAEESPQRTPEDDEYTEYTVETHQTETPYVYCFHNMMNNDRERSKIEDDCVTEITQDTFFLESDDVEYRYEEITVMQDEEEVEEEDDDEEDDGEGSSSSSYYMEQPPQELAQTALHKQQQQQQQRHSMDGSRSRHSRGSKSRHSKSVGSLKKNNKSGSIQDSTEETRTLSDDETDESDRSAEPYDYQQQHGRSTLSSSCAMVQVDTRKLGSLLMKDIWSSDSTQAVTALDELSRTAALSEDHLRAIVRLGGLLAVLRVLQTSAALSCAVAACNFLTIVCTNSVTAVECLNDLGAVSIVVSVMSQQNANAQVLTAACATLKALVVQKNESSNNSTAMIPSETVPTIVKAMIDFPSDSGDDDDDECCYFHEDAFGILATVCVDSPEHLKQLSASRGLEAMTLALQKPWKNDSDKNEAISTLSILLRSLPRK